MSISEQSNQDMRHHQKKMKCVVWDLDNTLWDGILLEDEHISMREEAVALIKTLDARGILQSIASKNDYDDVMAQLQKWSLDEYFLYPQINWNSKASSIKTIAEVINIGLDTIAFIDDQAFERDEVTFVVPEVMCIDAIDVPNILSMPEMNPIFITEDTRARRLRYMNDVKRKEAEASFVGPKEEFLASLSTVLRISPAQEKDLERAEELTVRTHQLNTTGYAYSFDELNYFIKSRDYKLFIIDMKDKYGEYGKIGLALLECKGEIWIIKLLLMSCRVLSRGVGTIVINYLMNMAKKHQRRLQAEFIANERNRMMFITYKFAGFKEKERLNNLIILENDLQHLQLFPDYVEVYTEE